MGSYQHQASKNILQTMHATKLNFLGSRKQSVVQNTRLKSSVISKYIFLEKQKQFVVLDYFAFDTAPDLSIKLYFLLKTNQQTCLSVNL